MSIFDRLNGGRQITMQDVQRDPIGIGREKGYNIPYSIGNNPQAIFQHLLQTGQIQSPMMQRLMPLMQRMGLK
jgi:hypothetical protein